MNIIYPVINKNTIALMAQKGRERKIVQDFYDLYYKFILNSYLNRLNKKIYNGPTFNITIFFFFVIIYFTLKSLIFPCIAINCSSTIILSIIDFFIISRGDDDC